jgi:protein SCO1/2
LSGLALDPGSLRLALVEAGAGRVGTFADHVRLLCYGFDPAAGTYTAAIGRWLAIAAAATLLVLGACFMLLMRAPAASGYRPRIVPPKRS